MRKHTYYKYHDDLGGIAKKKLIMVPVDVHGFIRVSEGEQNRKFDGIDGSRDQMVVFCSFMILSLEADKTDVAGGVRETSGSQCFNFVAVD